MTKMIKLANNNYVYLCDYNLLANTNFADIFLSSDKIQKISKQKLEITENLIRVNIQNLSMLVLEITETCNLRCKYCVFNDSYHHHRTFSSKHMTLETALKGIDYVSSLIKKQNKKKFMIGFYGGEPLLNFELVREVVKHTKHRLPNWEIRYNMTTNLTVLDSTMLDFIIKNKIKLMVSLDGGKEIHDSKRIFKNGKGTYETVIDNLNKIKRKNREYFKKFVTFSAVHSFDLPLPKAWDYFAKNELVKNNNIRFSNVDQNETTYYEKFPFNSKDKNKEITQIFSKMIEKLRKRETLSKLDRMLLNSTLNIEKNLRIRSFSDAANTCMFDSRIILDTQGMFHVCEKVNNTFPIGDIEHGLDIYRMAKLLNDFCSLIRRHCMDCEIQSFCNRCYSTFAHDGKFEIPSGFCEERKKSVINELGRYVQLKEEGLI